MNLEKDVNQAQASRLDVGVEHRHGVLQARVHNAEALHHAAVPTTLPLGRFQVFVVILVVVFFGQTLDEHILTRQLCEPLGIRARGTIWVVAGR